MDAAEEPKLCRRCKTNPATMMMRIEHLCESCYVRFTAQKVIKRMGMILKELRAPPSPRDLSPKYLLGLSFGSASSALLQILDENVRHLREKNPHNAYEVVAIHIDTDLSPAAATVGRSSAASPTAETLTAETPAADLTRKYHGRFSAVSVETVHISSALELDSVDWTALPAAQMDLEPRARLARMLNDLPSLSSSVDVLNTLTRQLLLSIALERGCTAMLFGSTLTTLAQVTLGATAKGRGFAVPLLTADGPCPISQPRAHQDTPDGAGGESGKSPSMFPIYYPQREIYRQEIVRYTQTSLVPLKDLISGAASDNGGRGSVVSHKDLSIENVMAQYFGDVEERFPGVIANVVRTAGKLSAPRGDACGICGMTLDEQGDLRWKGEIGEDTSATPGQESSSSRRLCYGCERSVRG